MDDSEAPLRISKVTSTVMITVALGFDIFELLVDWIPIAGQILSLGIDLLATLTFALWFVLKNVDLFSAKAFSRFWSTQIIELFPIPLLDFGITTLGVYLMILHTWSEDRLNFTPPTLSKESLKNSAKKSIPKPKNNPNVTRVAKN